MEKGLIVALKSRFDTIAHVDEESGIEFWYARELQKELGYQRWENFMIAIERAETACEKSKIECHNHFREVTKMVTIGSSAERGMFTIIEQFVICWVSVALSPRISHQKKISKRLKDALLLKKRSWHRIRVFLKNNCYGSGFIKVKYLNPYSSNRFMVCIACKGRSRC